MLNSINKKMLLVAGCLVSGMVVASEKKGHPCELLPHHLAPVVVAQQFCNNPGKHDVEILNENPQYKVTATRPMWFMSAGDVASVWLYRKGKQDPESINPFGKAIHSLRWDKVHGGDVLWVKFCDGDKGVLEVK